VPTIDTAKKILVAIGAITVQSRHSATGDQTSNLYTVIWSEPGNNERGGGQKTEVGVAKKTYPGGPKNEGTNLYPINLDPVNLDKEQQQSENLPAIPKPLSEFELFWKTYPRKAAKGAAKKAWAAAARKVPPQVILAGAERFSRDVNRQDEFTPHPATWLNQERWDDDPLPGKARAATGGDNRMGAYEELFNAVANRQGAINE
jgi:hypothetical protein